jgi:peptidoglycan/LPS O-acetylase OafA/YrhL
MIISLWYLCNRVNWEKQTWVQPIISFGNYSYGIYIFHNWIQMYLISSMAQRLFPLERWAGEHTILFPFGFFLLSLIISYLLTWLLLKTKIGRFLIG